MQRISGQRNLSSCKEFRAGAWQVPDKHVRMVTATCRPVTLGSWSSETAKKAAMVSHFSRLKPMLVSKSWACRLIASLACICLVTGQAPPLARRYFGKVVLTSPTRGLVEKGAQSISQLSRQDPDISQFLGPNVCDLW